MDLRLSSFLGAIVHVTMSSAQELGADWPGFLPSAGLTKPQVPCFLSCFLPQN
jgi:hypothetical protein